MGQSPTELSEHRNVFCEIALGGPAAFFAAAFSDEELAIRFAGATAETARDFVVLRCLAEVQKYGATVRRGESERERHSSGSRFESLVLESLVVERVAWQRRLLEALVTLINFSATNHNEHFAHFLAVGELEREQRELADERDFFGSESELTKKRIATLRQAVDEACSKLPASAGCWYLRANKPYASSTFRSQYLQALKLARPAERTALGYTYRLSFGDASERLHFGVLDPPVGVTPGDGTTDAACGLLAVAIICRAHDLCNVTPRGINVSLMAQAHRDRPVSELLSGRVSVGDFVLTQGPHLAEVLEIQTTQFGYESYRVEFLDTQNGPGLTESWLPAPAVGPFMKRQQMTEEVRAMLATHTDGELEIGEDEIRQSTREAVLTAWNAGLRKYVERQVNEASQADTAKP